MLYTALLGMRPLPVRPSFYATCRVHGPGPCHSESGWQCQCQFKVYITLGLLCCAKTVGVAKQRAANKWVIRNANFKLKSLNQRRRLRSPSPRKKTRPPVRRRR